MKNGLFVSLAFAGVLFTSITARAQYASSIVAFSQGSGANPDYNDPTAALGAPSKITPGLFGGPVDPFDPPYLASQIVQIGAGGFLTLQFSKPIEHNAANPFGLDFIIFGAAGFYITNGNFGGGGITDGTLFRGGTSTVRVSVSDDGSTFYTLNPSQAPIVDGLFPTEGTGNPLIPVNPSLSANDFAGKDLTGIRTLYGGSAGGAGFDLSWAGTPLSSVSFVKLEVLSDVISIDAISIVPEPASGMLVGIGAAILIWRRFRKG
jgi:hypothetical protein